MGSCYRIGHESGPWWEIICLRRTIQLRELAGKDTVFEKRLLEKWLKIPEYKNAIMPDNLSAHFNIGLSPQDADYVPIPDNLLPPAGVKPSDFDVLNYETKNSRGRPRKEGDISKTTTWRRKRELQIFKVSRVISSYIVDK